jgi:hypothetical protein
MSEKPTVYLSNWSSSKTPGHHGPGRKLTIMAAPRRWERGAGSVGVLLPDLDALRKVQAGAITGDEYRARFERRLSQVVDGLRPSAMWFDRNNGRGVGSVADGDTLCCACSRDEAAAGRCHRVWAAHALARNGWRVILDGVELHAPTSAGNLPPSGV